MNKLVTLLLVLTLPICVFGQHKNQKQPLPLANYDDNVQLPLTPKEHAQIIEVYRGFADKYVFDNSNRLKEIKNILRNRVQIRKYENKDLSSIRNLSEIAIIDPNIVMDTNIDAENLNPLKYNFNFYSRDRIKYFRIDNTQYLITILPQHTR